MKRRNIRKKILKILYDFYFRNPGHFMSRGELRRKLKISNRELDANMIYLEDIGYVELLKSLGSIFRMAKITSLGIEFIENEEL